MTRIRTVICRPFHSPASPHIRCQVKVAVDTASRNWPMISLFLLPSLPCSICFPFSFRLYFSSPLRAVFLLAMCVLLFVFVLFGSFSLWSRLKINSQVNIISMFQRFKESVTLVAEREGKVAVNSAYMTAWTDAAVVAYLNILFYHSSADTEKQILNHSENSRWPYRD